MRPPFASHIPGRASGAGSWRGRALAIALGLLVVGVVSAQAPVPESKPATPARAAKVAEPAKRLAVPRGWRRVARTAAATASAYSAGVATGAAVASTPASGTFVIGMSYAAVPAGAIMINKNGASYYLSGNTWFQPAYCVHYLVVPTP